MENDIYKAMADPTRRKIINLLKWQSLNAGAIASHFDISKPSISRHLNILENAELITSERDGNQIIYSLNVSVVQEVLMEFIRLFDNSKETSNGNKS